MEEKPIFPYKTLIWAVFAVLVIFLFKAEFKNLLSNAEELSVFGINIKASKDVANRLQDTIESFESQIEGLSDEITFQQQQMERLDQLKTNLEKDLAKCPDARSSVSAFNTQFQKIATENQELKSKSNILKNVDILTRNKLTNTKIQN